MPDFAPNQRSIAHAEDAPHGGRLLAEALRAGGVDTIFALCGGHIMPLFDACAENGIRIVDHRHEGAATMAAEGYALATGRTGVAAVTAGAGFTNGLTGLADAGSWSVPLVVIGGHAPLSQTGRGAVQDAPQSAIAEHVAKHVCACIDPRRIPRVTTEALYQARAGRTGAVYLEIAQDVIAAQADRPDAQPPFGYPQQPPTPAGAAEDVARAAELLDGAEKPIIVAGSGAFWSSAGAEIAALAEQAKIPVTTTSAARGLVPDAHRWCLGTMVHGGGAVIGADVVLILGSAFNANLCFGRDPLFAPTTKIIQVDIAPEGIGGERRPEHGVVGDVRRVVSALRSAVAPPPSSRDGWLAECNAMVDFLRGTWDEQIAAHRGSRIHAGAAVKELVAFARDAFGERVTLVADGGDALAWGLAYMYAEAPGRLLFTTTALGTLGVGMPFALGAKAARPDEPVILFTGDGAFGFTAMELDSAVRQKLPIIVVVSNNYGWRDVTHEQDMWFGKGRRFSTELADTRYDLLGEALGGHGEHVRRLEELRPALDRAVASGKTSVINVETDPEVLSDLLRNLGQMGIN